MRDSLAAEFPSAAVALARLRRPSVPREHWAWAALSGLGATAVTSAVLQLPLIAMRYANLRDPAAWAGSVVTIAAAGVGIAVAWRAGAARAVALYLAVRLAYSVAVLPGVLIFCDRSGETNCLFGFGLGQWTTVAGLIAAIALVWLIRAGAAGRSPALNATGAYVAVQQILSIPLGVLAFTAIRVDAPGGPIYLSLAAVAAAALAGAVLGVRRSGRVAALVPIGVIALNWTLELWLLLGLEPKPPWTLLTVLTGPAQVSLLLVAQHLAGRSRGGQ